MSMRSASSNRAKPISNSAIACDRIRHCRTFSDVSASCSRCASCKTPIARTIEPMPSRDGGGKSTPALPLVTSSISSTTLCNGRSSQRKPSALTMPPTNSIAAPHFAPPSHTAAATAATAATTRVAQITKQRSEIDELRPPER